MIFLDLVGTITDPDSDREGMIEIARRVKQRFRLEEEPEELWDMIAEIRRPDAERRHEVYIPFRFITADAVFHIMLDKRVKLSEEDLAWLENIYVEAQVEKAKLSKNALEGISRMKEITEHLGVISDADTVYLHEMLKALGVHEYFDSITSSEEAGFGKPNKKIFQMAMQRAGNPDRAIHIGDSERRDVEGALNSGLRAIRISEKDVKSRADYVARDLLDAAEWIENDCKETGK